MSYTAPDGDAINFSWVGKSAYTQPNGDAINFSWVDGGGGNGGGSTLEPIGQTIIGLSDITLSEVALLAESVARFSIGLTHIMIYGQSLALGSDPVNGGSVTSPHIAVIGGETIEVQA